MLINFDLKLLTCWHSGTVSDLTLFAYEWHCIRRSRIARFDFVSHGKKLTCYTLYHGFQIYIFNTYKKAQSIRKGIQIPIFTSHGRFLNTPTRILNNFVIKTKSPKNQVLRKIFISKPSLKSFKIILNCVNRIGKHSYEYN